MKGTIPTEQAVLVSPALDSCGSVELILLSKKGPPQKLHGVHPSMCLISPKDMPPE